MAFDQSSITEVRQAFDQGQLWISWKSSAPAGTLFQVYVLGVRVYSGADRTVAVPAPRGVARIAVGTVAAGERLVDFSGSLPAAPANRPVIEWLGGSFLDPDGLGDVAGFRIYRSPTAGEPVDYSTPVAELAAYEDGVAADGWDVGGWDDGGWGMAATAYAWTSPPLGRGLWFFAVRAFDAVGDESPAASGSVTIGGPPPPPSRGADGRRLRYTFNATTGAAALSWLAPVE